MQPHRKRHATNLRTTIRLVVYVGLAISNLAWLDPVRDAIVEANRLFDAGQFEEALTRYGQVLVDDPDSPLLNFNMGAAHYKAGNYDAALSSFARVPGEDDAQPRTARTAYNLGNTQYQLGAAAEAAQPQAALEAYTAAQAAYRRALGLDPSDQDAKFNYELVARKIEQLKERMQNQQQNQPQNQPPPDRQGRNQPEQQPDRDAGQDRHTARPERPQESAPEQQPDRGGEQQRDKPDLSEEEASALIDTAKSEELGAEEFIRQAQGGVVAEPLEDW